MTVTYKCSRCFGKGRIDAFRGTKQGVCFKCEGTGTQSTKPPKPSVLWVVLGEDKNTGKTVPVYNEKAQTAAAALKKARACFDRACEEFRAQYSLSGAVAVMAPEHEQWRAA
jgi:hypothetical protein